MTTTKTKPITIHIPVESSAIVTSELENIITAVFDEYMERKSDEILQKEIESSKVISTNVTRLQKLHAT